GIPGRSITLHGLRAAADLGAAGGSEGNAVDRDAAAGLLRHQDRHLVHLGELLDARGDVHGIADRRVLAALRRADVADDDATGVDADAHAQRRRTALGALAVEVLELLLHGERAAHGARRVIGLFDGRTEVGHDAVADELVERAAE